MEKTESAIAHKTSLPTFTVLLHESWEVYKQKWRVLVMIYLLPTSLSVLYQIVEERFFDAMTPTSSPPAALTFLMVFLLVVSIPVGLWAQAALLQAIAEKGKIYTIAAYEKGIKFILPLLWVNILAGLAILGGFLLLIIPGIIFAIKFYFADFVVISEGKRGTSALSRSSEYVKGRWWSVFGRVLPLGVFGFAVGAIVGIIFADSQLMLIQTFIINLFTLFFGPLSIVYTYLLYKHLKASVGK